jgi:uncharacterized protein YukE
MRQRGANMNVNGITPPGQEYKTEHTRGKSDSTSESKAPAGGSEASKEPVTTDTGVVYEPSTAGETAKTYTPNTKLIAQMKADTQNRLTQLQGIVEKLMTKQGKAYGDANDIWKFLAKGDYTVDAATKLQAQQDISEDGYWGVKQTSDRIVDFANALTGGDPSKIEEMREAFKKGFDAAAKAWGGDLPDISQQTYDAVMEKFDQMAEAAGLTLPTAEAALTE